MTPEEREEHMIRFAYGNPHDENARALLLMSETKSEVRLGRELFGGDDEKLDLCLTISSTSRSGRPMSLLLFMSA